MIHDAKNGQVHVIGTIDHDHEPIVSMMGVQVVPEGSIILDDEPTSREEYDRQSSVTMTPEQAREVAAALVDMADKMEDSDA